MHLLSSRSPIPSFMSQISHTPGTACEECTKVNATQPAESLMKTAYRQTQLLGRKTTSSLIFWMKRDLHECSCFSKMILLSIWKELASLRCCCIAVVYVGVVSDNRVKASRTKTVLWARKALPVLSIHPWLFSVTWESCLSSLTFYLKGEDNKSLHFIEWWWCFGCF